MGKICYRPVYNRNNHLNTQGKALLQIEAYLERKKIYFSTHIYITPKQWSSKKAKVIRHPKADSLNYFLQEYIMELEQKELELWRKGFEVSLDLLKHEINPKTSNTFLSFVNEEISNSPVKESTRNNLKTTWHLLSQFKPHLGFEDLTPRLIHNFEKYMYEKNLEVNTIAKHLKHLKSFINSAIDKGFIDANKNPLSHYKIKTCQSKHTFLLPEEIRKLENLQLAGHDLTLEHSLDAFLF